MIPEPKYPEGANLLRDKVVVVTAAAGTGIGSAVAKRSLEEGARVVVSDWHERRLAEKAAELGDVHAIPCDVTREKDVQALIAGAVERFGRIDVLVNNAGLGGTKSLLEMTDEEWSRVLDVTLNGTFRATRAALRQFAAQGTGGAIVNNASVLGWRAQGGQAHYAAAKAGVMALTRCAAVDAQPYGVRVNAITPGLTSSEHVKERYNPADLAARKETRLFKREQIPEDLVGTMVFLCSDASRFVTGQTLNIDGGQNLH